MVPGGGTGGLRLTGGSRGGGGGRPGGGGPSGGGWKRGMLGRLTSSTTTGSLPWSKGHMSPRMQKPFSERKKKTERLSKMVKKCKEKVYCTPIPFYNIILRTSKQANYI